MPKNSPSHTQNPEESAAILVKSDQNLIWLDCEMTGLDPDKERLIEIAIIVTGPNLEPRIEGPVLVIHQSDAHLDAMDKWNKSTHGKSGLIDKVKASTLTEADAETEILAFLKICSQRIRPCVATPLAKTGVFGQLHAQVRVVFPLPQH